MLELSVQRPTVHMQRYFYKKQTLYKAGLMMTFPYLLQRDESPSQRQINLPYPPTLIQLV